MKNLKRLVGENVFRLDDERIRELFPNGLNVFYGFNNYSCSMKHLNELKEHVLSDYPDTKDEDMEVAYILPFESIRHARFTMLIVGVPTEDFINLRKDGKIGIL